MFLDWHDSNVSQGQHFMTDLLVSSLMADGGLEISLDAAIRGISSTYNWFMISS